MFIYCDKVLFLVTNLNASITSPSIHEENLSHPTPHSNPVFTSFTSSLALFKESKLPSNITLSDLITLSEQFLCNLPVCI